MGTIGLSPLAELRRRHKQCWTQNLQQRLAEILGDGHNLELGCEPLTPMSCSPSELFDARDSD
jgi:hypothetical protein